MQAAQTQRDKQLATLTRRTKTQDGKRAIGVWGAAGVRLATIRARLAWFTDHGQWCCELKNMGEAALVDVVANSGLSRSTAYRMVAAWLEVPGVFELEDGWLSRLNFVGSVWAKYVELKALENEKRRLRRAKKLVSNWDETEPANALHADKTKVLSLVGLSGRALVDTVFSGKKAEHSSSDPSPAPPENVRRERLTVLTTEQADALPYSERLAYFRQLVAQDEPAPETTHSTKLGGKDAFRPELWAHKRFTEAEVAWGKEKAARYRGKARNFGAMVAFAILERRANRWAI